jgi:hypothetical protein
LEVQEFSTAQIDLAIKNIKQEDLWNKLLHIILIKKLNIVIIGPG